MSRGILCLLVVAAVLPLIRFAAPASAVAMPPTIHAVRFDPGYYYNTGLPGDVLAERLVAHWAAHGVNLVYFYAYSFGYGARYRTRYRYNQEEDFGRLDLMGRVVDEAHRRGIKVVAWVYVLRHRGAWSARPAWRSLTPSGQPYLAGFDRYFLSPHHPDAVRWWLGFLEDLLQAVPEIDGVDLAEPVVNWWGAEADHSDAARRAFAAAVPGGRVGDAAWRAFRTRVFGDVVRQSIQLVKRYGKEVHVTTVLTPRADGTYITRGEQSAETGFDLEAVLEGPVRPDFVNVEVIFQQWLAAHGAPGIFTPEWPLRAARAAQARVRGKAGVIAHVDLTGFGGIVPTRASFGRVLQALQAEDRVGIDIYGAHLLDGTSAWDLVRAAFSPNAVVAPAAYTWPTSTPR